MIFIKVWPRYSGFKGKEVVRSRIRVIFNWIWVFAWPYGQGVGHAVWWSQFESRSGLFLGSPHFNANFILLSQLVAPLSWVFSHVMFQLG